MTFERRNGKKWLFLRERQKMAFIWERELVSQGPDPARAWVAQAVPCHRSMEGLRRGSRGRSQAERSV